MVSQTPEEVKWRKSAYAPENLKRKLKLQYYLLGGWSLLTAAWIVLVCMGTDAFSWMTVVVLLAGHANTFLGIINLKRLIAGKKPY